MKKIKNIVAAILAAGMASGSIGACYAMEEEPVNIEAADILESESLGEGFEEGNQDIIYIDDSGDDALQEEDITWVEDTAEKDTVDTLFTEGLIEDEEMLLESSAKASSGPGDEREPDTQDSCP